MNGHCGITGSTYRPVEAGYPLLLVDTPERGDRLGAARALVLCLMAEVAIVLGILAGWAMGVKL